MLGSFEGQNMIIAALRALRPTIEVSIMELKNAHLKSTISYKL